VVLASQDEEQDLWVWSLTRTTLTRLTLDAAREINPIWTPDSQRLIFSSTRAGPDNLFVQAADGTGTATRLTESSNTQYPTGITPDSTQVIFSENTSQQRNIWLLKLTPTPRVAPLIETPFDERGGSVSPDGRWLAYESNRSGRYEIFVTPFPAVNNAIWQISTGGGVQPLWAPSGRELFYVGPDGALMTVPVRLATSTWSNGTPARLLQGPIFTGETTGNTTRQYDVTADGQRFLVVKDETMTGASAYIVVVQSWVEELKRLVPVN
jgi:Tol biopolymer transport system component